MNQTDERWQTESQTPLKDAIKSLPTVKDDEEPTCRHGRILGTCSACEQFKRER
jgi:hypothetical protein